MHYSGQEVFFGQNDLIVSKTDLKGRITYANHTFLEIAGYDEDEVIGQPHNLIRHPNMPRGVFELFWNCISQEKEIFAYVVNSTKDGGHYWVIAHVTPSFENGEVVGYHSTRRIPKKSTITNVIEPLYAELNQLEANYANRKEGTAASYARLMEVVNSKAASYDEFISSLIWEQ
ncbi:PAS domain S-box protein [Sneathiella sp. P13V-1]|uniref:PAS domain-containing protein n=1 Tax=Sneathiella sp. P13V-1 TaxID=2697366 RepID=UPI00187B7395|nr:PAS domain S-box protein [Sneathiella sp. P13V-1]MBE7638615.1 PAS domain S-box protein [Sneathiella sp. P13V-1]